MPDYKVHVFKDSDGEFRVHPPVIVLKGNADGVQLVNHTDEDLIWIVPAGPLQGGNPHTEPVGKKSPAAAAKKGHNTATVAASYQVYFPGLGKKAKGNSDPVLIIEN